MEAHIESRLAELKREYQAGEDQLREIVHREAALRETLLRISGAIQVLQELRDSASRDGQSAPGVHLTGRNGTDRTSDVLTVG